MDDFLVYSDSVFTHDLWISSDIAFSTILCVSHDYFGYQFDVSVLNSFTLSIPYVWWHSLFKDDFNFYME